MPEASERTTEPESAPIVPRAPLWHTARTMLRRAENRDLRRAHAELYARYGPVVEQGGGRLVSTLLFGPEANRFVLLDRDDLFSARRPWMAIMGEIFPNGLLLWDGDEHRHQRKIMHEAFKRPVLREYVEHMGAAVEDAVAGWAPDGPRTVRAYDAFKALTLDLAASIFVGVDLGPSARRMNEAFEAMVAASMPGMRLPLPVGRYHQGKEGRRFMLSFLGDMIPKKRGDAGGDLFSRLCRARAEDGSAFRDDQILDHMVFLMMAAHDTTTSTLTSMMWELARHPAWQERVREESRAFDDPRPGFDALDGLPSLTACMRETLRMHPPLPVIPRMALREFTWQGYRFPAGRWVVVSPIHAHYMDEWWDDPWRFDPERFLPERAEDRRHSHSFIPFGGGGHMCLGRRFAEAQVRLVMHQLVQRYRWSVPEGYTMPEQQAPIAKPTDGLPVELTPLD